MFTFIPDTITAFIRLFTQELSHESALLIMSEQSVTPAVSSYDENARRFWLRSI